ncbi:MAG: multicopper oxidase domain-containing protein, partial [Candidatus Nanopelagicales bacterium]|nr:multicopper oxidase domain-containing protein [Candidatus Nanopelagicales bacterium]
LMFESLAVRSGDEPDAMYGLLAEDIQVAPDKSWIAFRINPKARFINGDPVTAADVAHSFEMLTSKEVSPATRTQLEGVAGATVLDARTIRFDLKERTADTIFNVALTGHDLKVTHTDGYPVEPVTTSTLSIGMGERYDAIVTLGDGVFPFVAEPVGKAGLARALIRTGAGRVPAPSWRPSELDGYPLTVEMLQSGPGIALPAADPDSVQDVVLSGSMTPYLWTINGQTYENTDPLMVKQGQATRLRIQNHSMMPHPLHVHGHTFQIGPAGGSGPRKDTVLVPAMGAVEVDLTADNPGQWMVHCHNAYHAEAGMMTRLDYLT